MDSRRTNTENHLKAAKQALDERTKALTDKKLDEKARKRDVGFRQLQAVVRKYTKRLKAADRYDAIEADLVARRADRLANPKPPKVKKKKPVEAAKPTKAKKEKKAPAAG